MIRSGNHRGYEWLVLDREPDNWSTLARDHHVGLHCVITSFDSGPLRPNPAEAAAGWRVVNDLMISPPLTAETEIPYEQYDEWYLIDAAQFPLREPEIFVNYGGFHLVPVEGIRLEGSADPAWNRNSWEALEGMQNRFWDQLVRISPVTYVACGELFVIATRNKDFRDKAGFSDL